MKIADFLSVKGKELYNNSVDTASACRIFAHEPDSPIPGASSQVWFYCQREPRDSHHVVVMSMCVCVFCEIYGIILLITLCACSKSVYVCAPRAFIAPIPLISFLVVSRRGTYIKPHLSLLSFGRSISAHILILLHSSSPRDSRCCSLTHLYIIYMISLRVSLSLAVNGNHYCCLRRRVWRAWRALMCASPLCMTSLNTHQSPLTHSHSAFERVFSLNLHKNVAKCGSSCL